MLKLIFLKIWYRDGPKKHKIVGSKFLGPPNPVFGALFKMAASEPTKRHISGTSWPNVMIVVPKYRFSRMQNLILKVPDQLEIKVKVTCLRVGHNHPDHIRHFVTVSV